MYGDVVGAGLTNEVIQNESHHHSTEPHEHMFLARPIEIKYTGELNQNQNIAPYCKFKLGWHGGKCAIADQQALLPDLPDGCYLETTNEHAILKLKVKDKNRMLLRDVIGEAQIPLAEVISNGYSRDWYLLKDKHGATVAEVLVDVEHVKEVNALDYTPPEAGLDVGI